MGFGVGDLIVNITTGKKYKIVGEADCDKFILQSLDDATRRILSKATTYRRYESEDITL